MIDPALICRFSLTFVSTKQTNTRTFRFTMVTGTLVRHNTWVHPRTTSLLNACTKEQSGDSNIMVNYIFRSNYSQLHVIFNLSSNSNMSSIILLLPLLLMRYQIWHWIQIFLNSIKKYNILTIRHDTYLLTTSVRLESWHSRDTAPFSYLLKSIPAFIII